MYAREGRVSAENVGRRDKAEVELGKRSSHRSRNVDERRCGRGGLDEYGDGGGG